MDRLHKLIRGILIIIGFIFLFNGLIILTCSNLNLGTLLTIFIGLVLICYGALYNRLKRYINKYILIIFILCLVSILALMMFLGFYGRIDSTKYDDEAIIILGCGIRGDKVSHSLQMRLDKGIEYYNKKNQVLIVVSGGQGPKEDITEAKAMKNYLVRHNIPAKSIIMEQQATSTYENMVYSKSLLDKIFDTEYSITYITNGYHSFRAGLIANNVGLEAKRMSAPISYWLTLPAYTRECLALAKYLIMGS